MKKKILLERTVQYFPNTAASILPKVEPFEAENYRRLNPTDQTVVYDGVRQFLRDYLPSWISWPEDEKISRKAHYEDGGYAPRGLSNAADRLARFIVAMGGALFILVPMYIMALRQNPVQNLITTTVAVVLFALVARSRSSRPVTTAIDPIPDPPWFSRGSERR